MCQENCCANHADYNTIDELSWSMLETMITTFLDRRGMKRLFVPSEQRPNKKLGVIITDKNDVILQKVDHKNVDILLFDLHTKNMTRILP